MTIKIFVADDVSDSGLEPLRSAGFKVEKRVGLSRAELAEALKDSDGLIVRSETKVTAELLDETTSLRVIGRAGVGVDNIDVPAATMRGVVVMNAPDGNTITTAEHAIALLVSLAARPTHGYELIERLPELSGEERVDVGNLYRSLRSLEEEGLVTSEWQPDLPGPAKRTYTLTPEGHAVLASWLAAVEQLRDGLTMFLDRAEEGGDHVRTTPPASVE